MILTSTRAPKNEQEITQWLVRMQLRDGRVIYRGFSDRWLAERFLIYIPFNQVMTEGKISLNDDFDWGEIASARIEKSNITFN